MLHQLFNLSKIMKKLYTRLILILPALFPALLTGQTGKLVWSDEFNYTGHPDPASGSMKKHTTDGR